MEYPAILMRQIRWNFDDKKYADKAGFVKQVKEYNQIIQGEAFDFDGNLGVLDSSKVVIQYMHHDQDDEPVEPDFELRADNGSFFSQGELLFKVHNEVCGKLAEEDHKFFEGFELWNGESPNYPGIPLYFLVLGS